ncbi:hypothetical protein [Dactylosporangium sp. NPDC051541]|uniref:hypothetical protein n=1 Tax=Dactylosporangium sp. NPDC051541 TaxID=3363977 RepID=UPI0037AA8B48
MTRRGLVAVLVGALMLGGCARGVASPPAGSSAGSPAVAEASSAADWPAGVKEAEVYTAVLHRYLGTRDENSISANGFATTYVLAQAISGEPLPDNAKYQITTAMSDVTTVRFVATREEVVVTSDGCPHTPPGTILVTLGTIDGDDNTVQVKVYGFVACLGATWLTYVLRNSEGPGWTVTGTTGERAIA